MITEVLEFLSTFKQIYTFNPKKVPPERIYIEVTGACNFTCPSCPRTYSNDKRGHMPDNIFRKVIEDIAEVYPELKNMGFHFFGELLIRKDFDVLINWARKKLPNTHFGISINLYTLKQETFKKLLLSGLNEIGIWPDGFSNESYAQLRTGESFSKIKENINDLLEERKRLLKSDVGIHIGMIKYASNQNFMDEFCKEFNFVKRYPGTRLVTSDSHDWAGQVSSNNVIHSLSKYKYKFPRPSCMMPYETMVVSAKGDVSLCCYDMNLKLKIGNVMRDGKVNKIWSSKKTRNIRRGIMSSNPPELCKHCYRFYYDLTLPKIVKRKKDKIKKKTLEELRL